MFNYFKDVLATLKRIEEHLAKLAACVRESDRDYGDRGSISTKHWNDK